MDKDKSASNKKRKSADIASGQKLLEEMAALRAAAAAGQAAAIPSGTATSQRQKKVTARKTTTSMTKSSSAATKSSSTSGSTTPDGTPVRRRGRPPKSASLSTTTSSTTVKPPVTMTMARTPPVANAKPVANANDEVLSESARKRQRVDDFDQSPQTNTAVPYAVDKLQGSIVYNNNPVPGVSIPSSNPAGFAPYASVQITATPPRRQPDSSNQLHQATPNQQELYNKYNPGKVAPISATIQKPPFGSPIPESTLRRRRSSSKAKAEATNTTTVTTVAVPQTRILPPVAPTIKIAPPVAFSAPKPPPSQTNGFVNSGSYKTDTAKAVDVRIQPASKVVPAQSTEVVPTPQSSQVPLTLTHTRTAKATSTTIVTTPRLPAGSVIPNDSSYAGRSRLGGSEIQPAHSFNTGTEDDDDEDSSNDEDEDYEDGEIRTDAPVAEPRLQEQVSDQVAVDADSGIEEDDYEVKKRTTLKAKAELALFAVAVVSILLVILFFLFRTISVLPAVITSFITYLHVAIVQIGGTSDWASFLTISNSTHAANLTILSLPPPCFLDSVNSYTPIFEELAENDDVNYDDGSEIPEQCKDVKEFQPCPDGGVCSGGVLLGCTNRGTDEVFYFQASYNKDACVLTEQAWQRIDLLKSILHDWTLVHECGLGYSSYKNKTPPKPYSFLSYNTVDATFALSTESLPLSKSDAVHPLFLLDELAEAANLTLPVGDAIRVIETANVNSSAFFYTIDPDSGEYIIRLDGAITLPISCTMKNISQSILSLIFVASWNFFKMIILGLWHLFLDAPIVSTIITGLGTSAVLTMHYVQAKRVANRQLEIDIINLRQRVYAELSAHPENAVPAHLICERIIWADYPSSRAQRSRLANTVWPHVVSDIQTDNRIAKTKQRLSTDNKLYDHWQWIDVVPARSSDEKRVWIAES